MLSYKWHVYVFNMKSSYNLCRMKLRSHLWNHPPLSSRESLAPLCSSVVACHHIEESSLICFLCSCPSPCVFFGICHFTVCTLSYIFPFFVMHVCT